MIMNSWEMLQIECLLDCDIFCLMVGGVDDPRWWGRGGGMVMGLAAAMPVGLIRM